ncbi:transglycosylase domain-containing protein [Sphingomonas lenta]|uniref:Penicillin-binding protein n=1 Tax=Sphingomonas lenta TaxID=1141887 RepID=A0A2A2SGM7_9SPHN|nr:transglycosylase domain-containing protein [Sphingomonas lenta]PAX08365.1 penicillin-binding protein [Sphingomonas lenta]
MDDLTAPSGRTEPLKDDWGYPLPPEPPAPKKRRRWGRIISRTLSVGIILLVVAIGWLAITAPLSKSLKPPTPPSITLTADDGTPIARRGAIIGRPVDAAKLPDHVREAFLAIEDRRFYDHWGISLRGIARAAWSNFGAGGVRQGGSTITQQLAKNAFLDSDRTMARKFREVMIAFWLETWLTKDEILSRYLSNVYFGDNVYGLTAASKHYFGRTPQNLNIGQAAMLAGLVKAPSRLAPTSNLSGARKRQAVVVGVMVDAGFLTEREADRVQPQRVKAKRADTLPSGTYFADWVLPEARDRAGEVQSDSTVETTLNRRLQRAAERSVRAGTPGGMQAALVAMRPDGKVVALVGGRDYAKSSFNRATQARRQPGSTFKLFVYLAALRQGMTPASTVEDRPVDIAGWKPRNNDGRYLGEISLAQAFARSSNVAAARLTQDVGVKNVIKAARDLGISTPIANEATIGLGTSGVSLLELTAAYAAVARGRYPVQPHGLKQAEERSWYQTLTGGGRDMPERIHEDMLSLLGSAMRGTGYQARLPVEAFGKTGTTQDGRDAWFVGFAGDLVVGVWVGRDDNKPAGLTGSGAPARIWRDFMSSALNIAPPPRAPVAETTVEDVLANEGIVLPEGAIPELPPLAEQLEGLGVDLQVDPEGTISVGPSRREERPPPPPREERRPPVEEELEGEF